MPYPRRPARKVGASRTAIVLLAVLTGLILLLLTAADPAGTLVGFVLSSAAALVVLVAYRRLDRWEPEPRRLLELGFLWGASIAVLLAVVLEAFSGARLGATPLVSKSFDQAAIQAPFIEEAAKGLFLLIMMTGRRRRELDSLTDCMVYAGVTALGFAWMEDIAYLAAADSSATLAVMAVARLTFAPFAHPLFTTMTGIGVYVALRRRGVAAKAGAILLGYLAAVALHASWNASLTLGDGQYFLVSYLFWMVPIFTLMVVLGVLSRRHEQQLVAAKLPGMVAAGLITPNEATWLGSLSTRRRAIGEAKRIGGRSAGRSVARFAAAVVELAFARDRIDRGSADPEGFALLNQEVQEVAAARYAAPTLQWLAGHRAL